MKKKKKKKREAEAGMGYCPFSVCAGSRYRRLYRDTARLGRAGEAGLGAGDRPRYGRLGHDTTHDTTKGGHDTAGARPGWG